MAYLALQDIRAEGVTDPPYNDAYVTGRIAIAQALIERLTKQFFEKRADYVLKLKGRGHDTLWLPVPPVSESSVASVRIAGDDEDIDPETYEVEMDLPDGRMNPKLVRTYGTWSESYKYVITGDFGFVEADESTPLEIKDLAKRLVVYNLPKIGDVGGQRESEIIREKLRDYEYQLSEAAQSRLGPFGDRKIDRLIAMFTRTMITTV